MSTAKGIWVFTEEERGELKKVSLEILSEGRKLADGLNEELCALLLGQGVEPLAGIPPRYGADKVYLMEHEFLPYHNVDSHVDLLTDLTKEFSPRIVLFGATSLGKELAPRVAARLKVGLVTECVDIKIDGERLLNVRKPVYGGKAHVTFACAPATPQMATIAPGAMDVKEPDDKREGEIIRLTPKPEGEPARVEFIEFVKGDPRAVSLTEAEMIVAIGRGLEKGENFHLIEEFADVLGASIGGSRVAVDMGWILLERQIGMTGKTVAPRLFISCGISGQYPHTVGMEASGTIVVLNKERNAPMFKLADMGILGDMNQVIPAMTKRIKELVAAQEGKSR